MLAKQRRQYLAILRFSYVFSLHGSISFSKNNVLVRNRENDKFFHFRENFYIFSLRNKFCYILTCEWYSRYPRWWEAVAPARKISLFECFSVNCLIPFLYFIIRKIHKNFKKEMCLLLRPELKRTLKYRQGKIVCFLFFEVFSLAQ